MSFYFTVTAFVAEPPPLDVTVTEAGAVATVAWYEYERAFAL